MGKGVPTDKYITMIRTALSRLAKGSFIYGVGGMLQRFIALLLLPLFTKELSPEDYGVVTLISLVGIAMSGVLTLGTANSMGLLYFREINRQKRPTIIWTNLFLMTINGGLWLIVLYLCSPSLSRWMFQTEQFADLIRLGFIGNVFITITDPFLAYLRMEEKAKQYMVLTVLGALFTISLSIYLVLWIKLGVFGLIMAGAIGSALNLGLIGVLVGRRVPFGYNPRLIIPLVRIGFPSIFGLFAFLLIDYADRQMIERMIGLSNLGVYSVGYSFGIVMAIAVGAFSTAWPPFFMSFAQKREEAREVFAQVLNYYIIFFGGLILIFYLGAKPLVLLITDTAFHESWVVIGLVAASYAFKGCYLILLPGIYFADKLGRQSVIEWIAAIINIALNFWLIPIYGIMGAALATFASYSTLPLLAWVMARQYLEVNYQWRRIFINISLIVICILGIQQIAYSSIKLTTKDITFSSAILLVYFTLAYRFLLNENERDFILIKLKA